MVKFITKLDANAVKDVNRMELKRLFIPMLVLSLFIIVLGALYITENLVSGITTIVLGALIIPLWLGLTALLQKSFNKKMPILSGDTINEFTFDENCVIIHQKEGERYEDTCRSGYDCFSKAYITPTHYFLFVSATQCHSIPKSSLVEGSLEEADGLLVKNLGKKVKIKK